MDLPLSATQRAGSRQGELVGSLSYELALADDGLQTARLRVDRMHSHRVTLDLGYGVTSWLTPNVALPVQTKLIDERIGGSEETRSTFGLGDAVLLVKLTVVGAAAYAPGKLRLWLAPGVKLPTGSYRHSDDFGRIAPPAQPGTGSVDAIAAAFASVGLTGEGSAWLLLSQAVLRLTTANDEGYRFGHTLDASALVQVAALDWLALRAGPALHGAGRDRAGDIAIVDSGGWTLGARWGAALSLAEQMSLALDLELPVLRDVHGEQLDPVINGSLGLLIAADL